MATKIEYSCDKCGKVETEPSQLWSILILVINRPGYTQVSSFHNVKHHADWCRACVEKAGMLPVQEVKKEEVLPLSIDDLVREIVHEECPYGR